MSKRLTIEDMQAIANERGGKCVSKAYANNRTKLQWECGKGHRWEAVPSSIKSGKWCPYCSGNVGKSIEDMHALATARGGKCLSYTYINSKTKLKWECAQGHRWESIPNIIQQGSWCPRCLGKNKESEDMHELAVANGGKCLSNTYVNSNTKLKWECAEGHRWEAIPNTIQQGHWCPYCSGNLGITIERIQELAASRGGKCLCDSYVNIMTKLKWECAEGHIWEAALNSIKNAGSWCPVCSGLKKKTIEEMHELATARGGKCLSDTYVNSSTKLKWECAEGHIWETTPNSIQIGQWCPSCATGFGERVTRLYFEALFGRDFPKIRPEWLINERGNRMELDGFCKSLGLAFEHQGQHHYRRKFGMTDKALAKRQRDDQKKEALCLAHGVTLVQVPEIGTMLNLDDLEEFIRDELTRLNCNKGKILKNFVRVNLSGAYIDKHRIALEEMQAIAKERGGKCLFDSYVNSKTKLKWECVQGHRWEATPNMILKGTWCPNCSGNVSKTIEDMHELAAAKGGKCLSKAYANNRTKLQWECAEGHHWESSPSPIKSGSWCPYCAGLMKKTIEDMHIMAAAKGGKCLSDTYVNSETKLEWKCAEGHRWEGTPHNVKTGYWCPYCAGKIITIEEMRELAAARGGKCLSDTYVNSKTKLKWECAEFHIWETAPNSIKNAGSWCPVCAKEKKRTKQNLNKRGPDTIN